MALMEATLVGTYGGVECVNRFTYQSSGTPAAVTLSFLLVRAMGGIASAGVYPPTGLMQRIANSISENFSFVTLTAKDLYSVTDFYSLPFVEPLTGVLGGDAAAPNVTYGYRTNRVRSDIRRGTKHFSGVAETTVGGVGFLAGGYISGVGAALATALGAVLTETDEGNTVTFTPVVMGRQRYNPATHLPDPAGKAYRYYPTYSEQLSHLAAGVVWDIYSDTRTQTSRTRGHGR